MKPHSSPNLIMIDFARHDARSAAVRCLGRSVVPFSKDLAPSKEEPSRTRIGGVVTAIVGLAVGAALVLLMRGG